MMAEGFVPVSANQAKSRVEGKTEYTKHMVRLQKKDCIGMLNRYGQPVADTHEIVLINSHDGTSSYQIMSGVYRQICSNGMVAYRPENEEKIHHTGDIIGNVINASYRIIDDSAEIMSKIDEMKNTILKPAEKLLLAEIAMSTKFEPEENEKMPFEPAKLLQIRRSADKTDDLYTQFNIIQENLIKGGVRYRDEKYNRHTTRAVNSIDGNVKINKMLWQLTEKMLELKK